MILTEDQERGLKIAVERYNNHEKYTVIAGYAGSGKTTLVHSIVEALNIPEKKVAYAAYTGKAAEVLRKNNNPNAITLHKLLYETILDMKTGEFINLPKRILNLSLIVVDECSMVEDSIIDLLLSHSAHIIFLGDPFQLDPIRQNQKYHLLAKPHIFLEKIMRQEEESEIIQLTMKLRQGESISSFNGNNVKILPNDALSTGMLTWADEILCATNATRVSLNQQLRNIYGFEGLPQDGEKMICLRNYWDICNKDNDPIINGTVGTISNTYQTLDYTPKYMRIPFNRVERIVCNFQPEIGKEFPRISIDKNFLLTGKETLDYKMEALLKKAKKSYLIPLTFDFAYALTVHKAQGSAWSKVLVIEENFPFNNKEHARWLYTSMTRAEDKLVVIQKE